MPLPWFRIDRRLFMHHKSLLLSKRLNRPNAWQYILLLWNWCIDYAPDGRVVVSHLAEVVENVVGWDGEPGRFIDAALDAGFLERDGEALVVHDWSEGIGADIAKAESEAARLRQLREKKKVALNPVRPGSVRRTNGDGTDANAYVPGEMEKENKMEKERENDTQLCVNIPPSNNTLPGPLPPRPLDLDREAIAYRDAYRELYANQRADFDQKALDTFREIRQRRTLPELLTSLRALAADDSFGRRLVLQATLHENCVQKGLLLARAEGSLFMAAEKLPADAASGEHRHLGSRPVWR